MTIPADLDKGGNYLQRTKVYNGPSLGWAEAWIKPSTLITTGISYTVVLGDYSLLINVAAAFQVFLPDLNLWLTQFRTKAAQTTLEEALYIKDFGGNAATFNITVTPFGTQRIDNLAQNFTIGQNRQLLRLYPIADASGWYSA